MLITGANGRIGSDLVKFFSKKTKVYALYRNNNKINRNLKNKNIIWIKHDLKKNLKRKINSKIIIHCAGIHSFSKNNDFDSYISSNIIGLKNLLEFASKRNFKKIIHISSVDVYGEITKKILNEKNKSKNPGLLGSTKILMEEMISKEKIDFLNIRVPGVVGYQIYDSRYPWFSRMLHNLINNKAVNLYNSDKKFNNILDTLEIFNFLNFIKKKKLKNETINLAASKPINLKEMILMIKNSINSKSKIILKKNKSKHFVISNYKVLKLFNYKPSGTKNIVKRYIENLDH